MKITLNRINEDFLFENTNNQGNKIRLDNITLPNPQGFSPMESVLAAVAGCSSIDILAILKKQRQNITNFSAEIEGERVQIEDAKPFKSINLKFFLEGEIDAKKALRATELSFEKYCSVSKSLNPNISINYKVFINGEKA